MLRNLALALSLTALPFAALPVAAWADPVPRGTVAFFGLYLMNNQGDADPADEQARIAAATRQIEDDLTARGFTLVDTAPVAAKLAQVKNIADCNGCDLKLAAELGADYALTGEVQKTSELILTFNLFLRDVAGRSNLRQGTVDIRGNTDESWTRGYRYLLKNIIFKGES